VIAIKKIILAVALIVGMQVSIAQTVFQYDVNGNMVTASYTGNNPCNSSPGICPGTTISFYANYLPAAETFQWQADTGTGFINIVNGPVYSGADTKLLTLQNPPTTWYGYRYRCLITTFGNTEQTQVEILKFTATWIGTTSTEWENPLNWGCNKIPDANTDVFVRAGSSFFPTINSIVFCRSFNLEVDAACNVSNGNLKITGR
jgi:hypothetical protein